MELKTMHPPQKDSPATFLLGSVTETDTILSVASSAILPQSTPYPLTIGVDKSITEVVTVTGINNDTDRLTVTRGEGARQWDAGTKLARVFNAQDLKTVQDNIVGINEELGQTSQKAVAVEEAHNQLRTKVEDPQTGLEKKLTDEIARATAAENTEANRAKKVEGDLNKNKADKNKLTQVITDWRYIPAANKFEVEITRYNAHANKSSTFKKTIPGASTASYGLMTPESMTELVSLRNDVTALQNQGGKFIGQSFATKAALDTYSIPATVKLNDFTYVIDDESKSGATTRYVYNGAKFNFAFVVNYDPIGVATSSTAGVVKSTDAPWGVSVQTNGTMAVNTSTATNETPGLIKSSPLSGRITLDAEGVGFINDGFIVRQMDITIQPGDWQYYESAGIYGASVDISSIMGENGISNDSIVVVGPSEHVVEQFSIDRAIFYHNIIVDRNSVKGRRPLTLVYDGADRPAFPLYITVSILSR